MLVCEQCGNQNPLGRIFCGGCGAKLDLSRMKSEDVAHAQKINRLREHWWKLLIVIGVALVGMIGLALWPETNMLGHAGYEGKPRDGQKVKKSIKVLMQYIRSSRPTSKAMARKFSERGINGYFKYVKAKDMNLNSLSVSIMDGYVAVRVIHSIGPIALGPIQWTPKVSYDVVLEPVKETVVPSKASIGHLPMLVGPAKNVVMRTLYKELAKEKEWEPFTHVIKIKATERKLMVVVKK